MVTNGKRKPNKVIGKKKQGPVPMVLDWGQIARLAEIQCTEFEIIYVLDISKDTLVRHCKKDNNCTVEEFLQKHHGRGRVSLRRWQWRTAEGIEGVPLKEGCKILRDEKGKVQWLVEPVSPSATMQIWLGKQYLEQVDKQELGGAGGGPVEINIISKVPRPNASS